MLTSSIIGVSCQSGKTLATKWKSDVAKDTITPNELTQKEKYEGWILLFDRKTGEGWRGSNKTDFPKGWKIVDGTLHYIGTGTDEAGEENGG